MSKERLRVLLVDDEVSLRKPLAQYLQKTHDYQVDAAASGEEAINLAQAHAGQYAVVLLDYLLAPAPGLEPEPLGIKLMVRIKVYCPQTEFILFTGWDLDIGLEALRAGAYRYLRKPFDHLELGPMIEHAAEHRRLKGMAHEKQILEQLMAISAILHSGRSSQEVLNTVLHGVQSFGFDRVRLYLLSPDEQFLEGQAQVGMDAAFVGVKLPVANAPYMQALLTDPRPQVFTRAEGNPIPYEQILAKENVNQWASVPLLLQGKVIGKLSVDNKSSRRPIAEVDLGPVALLAAQAASAIENVRLMTALSEQKDHRDRLIASSPAGVIAIDNNGQVTSFNEQAQKSLKYQAAEVLGRPVADLYADWEKARQVRWLLRQAPDGKLANHLTFVRSKDGELIPIRLSATWLYDAQGNRIGSVGYFEDLRTLRETEARLDLLLNASNTVAQAENLSEGLHYLTKMVVTSLGATFGGIALLDERAQFLLIEAVFPTQDGPLEWEPGLRMRTAVQEWLGLAEFFSTGSSLILRKEEEQWQPVLADIERRFRMKQGIQSLLLIPLRAGQHTVGLLYLGELPNRPQAIFTPEKVNLAKAIADQTAVLIERIRLHEITKRRGQLLEALDETSRNIRAETETAKLLQEVVRLAAQLVGFAVGGLYIYRPRVGEVELTVTYPPMLAATYLSQIEALVTQVAGTGQPEILHHTPDQAPDQATVEKASGVQVVVGVPLKQAGEVEAVLFVADDKAERQFTNTDLEVLKRFAVQAAIALKSSRLMSQEQRMLGKLAILHKLSDYIQATDSLDKIFSAVLTAVTAGYGLGFNRAALLLLDERREQLVGQVGIGHIVEAKARVDWLHDQQHGSDFGTYLLLLEQDHVPITPIGERIATLSCHIQTEQPDVFSWAVQEKQWLCVMPEQFGALPAQFRTAFAPSSPLIVAPLIARSQVIGLLIADNKFTQAPITSEDADLLLTFTNTAAVTIDNVRLRHETEVARERLHSFFEASNALVSSQDTEQMLTDIVEQARRTAEAERACTILLDEQGQIRDLVVSGMEQPVNTTDLIRPDGYSMQVMHTGRPVVIEDTRKQRGINPSAFWDGIAAGFCLPMLLQNTRIGVMWFHYHRPRHISNWAIEAAQLYVNQAALAYDSAQRMAELEHMHRAAEAITGVAGVQKTLEQIVHSAQAVLNADSAVIYSYDAVQKRFDPEISVAAGIAKNELIELKKVAPRRGGTADAVMKRGWIGVTDISNLQQYSFLGQNTPRMLKHIGARSFQGIALIVGDEKLGVLYVNYNRRRNFTLAEQETAKTFANYAALALKKAKLLEQISQARNTARVVAKVATLGELDKTLELVVSGIKEALHCDAITLYVYYEDKRKLSHPPTMIGVDHPDRAQRFAEVAHDSIVFRMLQRDLVYIVEDIAADPLFKATRFAQDEEIQSCLAVSLTAGNQRVGVMFINYRTPHRFTEDELADIELFANQAAVAIHNALLYENVEKRASILTALYDAGRTVTSSLDLDEILNRLAEQASLLTGFKDGSTGSNIALVKETTLQYKATYPRERLRKVHQALGAEIDLRTGRDGRIGVIGRAIITGEPQLIDDVARNDDYIASHEETRSELAVPIKANSTILGAINVERPYTSAFTTEDVLALAALAAQAASAILNAQSYQQATRRLEESDALAQVAISLAGTTELHEVLNLIMTEAMKLTETHEGHVLIWDTQRKEFTKSLRVDSSGVLKPYQSAVRAENGFSRMIITHRQPVVIPDLQEHPNINPAFTAKGYRATVGVPLINQGEVIGVLYVSSKGPRQFSERQVTLLQTMANQVAVAIDRASRYEELKQTKIHMNARTRLAWMGMANNTWRHSIEKHALTIREQIQLLRQDLHKVGLQQNLARMVDRLTMVERLANQIAEKPVNPALSAEEGLESVAINQLITERIDQLWRNDPYRTIPHQLELRLLDSITVCANPEWLRRVLDSLLENAADAVATRENQQITIITRAGGFGAEIEVSDTGPGIPEEVQARLGLDFIEKPEDAKGLGMGLLLAQTIVQTYGGKIRVAKTGPTGTTMVIELPIET